MKMLRMVNNAIITIIIKILTLHRGTPWWQSSHPVKTSTQEERRKQTNLKSHCHHRQKNGKILMELSFLAVFDHKDYLEKVWKSRNKFELVGFKIEKNGPCSRENKEKYFKKCKMAKNDFLWSDLSS